MRVEVTDHSAIVALMNAVVNVGKVLAHHFAVPINPDFTALSPIATLLRKPEEIVDHFRVRHDLLYHLSLLSNGWRRNNS